MLELRGVVVTYGDVRAVDGVDLTVHDGEVVSVLGPSGCGKSTLLRAVAGLEPLTAGSVVRDGADLAGVPPHRRDVGLMFQDHALFPHRDVLGNVLFGLRAHRVARDVAIARATEMLALVGLEGFEHRPVSQLSGGEQQRVALARALAPAPSVLMLDEPLGSLDRRLRDRLVTELRDLLSGLGVTAIFVTHDHDEALAIADHVAIMRAGRFEQVGTAVDVWRRPATEFAARFLGWNVTRGLDGTLVAIRPDGLHPDPAGPIEGVIVGRVFRRDHSLLRVRLQLTDEDLEVASRGDVAAVVGDRVRLRADPAAVVRFEATDRT